MSIVGKQFYLIDETIKIKQQGLGGFSCQCANTTCRQTFSARNNEIIGDTCSPICGALNKHMPH